MIGLPSSAILADRDPALLDRLVRELGRRGILVEALSSPAGLTTDLVGHARPELLILDAGLPGLEPRHAAGLVRALKQTINAHVVLVVEGSDAGVKAQTGVDAIIPRAALIQRGIDALGLPPGVNTLDPRRVIDTVLGSTSGEIPEEIEARLDLLSDDMIAVGPDGRVVGELVEPQPDAGHRAAAEALRAADPGDPSLRDVGRLAEQRDLHVERGAERRREVARDEDADDTRAALARLVDLREPLTWTA